MTLALAVNQTVDLGVVYKINSNGVHESTTIKDLFAGKRLLVFMGPAPFSKLDTEQAIEFEYQSNNILAQKIDGIIGLYVQDAFIMKKFQEHVHETSGTNNVQFYADGDGFFVKANNLTHDFTFSGLGTRCGRWAFIINDGVVEYVTVDDYSFIETTGAHSILKQLKNEA